MARLRLAAHDDALSIFDRGDPPRSDLGHLASACLFCLRPVAIAVRFRLVPAGDRGSDGSNDLDLRQRERQCPRRRRHPALDDQLAFRRGCIPRRRHSAGVYRDDARGRSLGGDLQSEPQGLAARSQSTDCGDNLVRIRDSITRINTHRHVENGVWGAVHRDFLVAR